MTIQSAPTTIFVVPPNTLPIPTVQVTPEGTGTGIPFLAGLYLGDGSAPPGSELTIPQGQVKVQTRWNSGSPKHVVLSGTVDGPVSLTPAVGLASGAPVDGPARIAQVGANITVAFDAYRPFHRALATVAAPNADRSIPAGGIITLASAATWPSTGPFFAVLTSRSSHYNTPFTNREHNGPYPITRGATGAEAVLTTGAPRPWAQNNNFPAYLAVKLGTYTAALSAATLLETFWEGPSASYYKYEQHLTDQFRVWWYVLVLADGQVEVEPVLIKGCMSEVKASDMDFVVGGVSISGTPRAPLGTYCHYTGLLYCPGTSIFHGEGVHCGTHVYPTAKPEVRLAHDTVALRAAKVVPNYVREPRSNKAWDAQFGGSGTANLVVGTTKQGPYQPGHATPWDSSHGTGGYRDEIAPLPRQDGLYLTSSADPRAFWAMTAGAKGKRNLPSWLLDDATSDWPDWTDPNWSRYGYYTPSVPGLPNIDAMRWDPYTSYQTPIDVDHFSAAGWLPYAMTGRRFHLDQLHAETSTACMRMLAGHRSPKVLQVGTWAQERGYGWWLRNWGLICESYPDGDPRKERARQIFVNNLRMKVDDYPEACSLGVTPAFEPLGWGFPGGTPPIDAWSHVGWQHAYTSGVLGWLWDLQVSQGANVQVHQLLRDLYYKQTVGQLGDGVTGFDVRVAPKYIGIAVTPRGITMARRRVTGSSAGLYPIPPSMYQTWAEVWTANAPFYTFNGDNFGSGQAYDGYGAVSPGYGPQLLPSIAYAVDHQYPGAAAAYARLVGVGNWDTVLNSAPTGTAAPYADQWDCPNWSMGPR